MGLIGDKLLSLTGQLFPTGRAFWIKVNSDKENLLKGLLASEERAYNDATAILNSILPDNDNFTAGDATSWEKRLGLITNQLVPLSDRKDAIKRKMNHPGTIPARQNYLYLQGQLQAAGFDVYVYENRFSDGFGGYVTKTPDVFSLLPFPHGTSRHGQFRHGQIRHGQGFYSNKIANNVEKSLDDPFKIGSNYRFTFFIGGPTPGTWATVDANRELEFRQLVLRIKPVHTVALLLLNFY